MYKWIYWTICDTRLKYIFILLISCHIWHSVPVVNATHAYRCTRGW